MPHVDDLRDHVTRALLCALMVACSSAAPSGVARATPFETNLIVNGDAESDAPSATGYEVIPAITGWARTGNLTIIDWTEGTGFPVVASPGPVVRGTGFFAGGPNSASSQMVQTIDLSDLAAMIDAGGVNFRLDGYLGGFSTQTDHASFQVTFRNALATAVGFTVLGPVTVTHRASTTGLLRRALVGGIPAGTRSVDLRLLCTRFVGTYNDGFADSLSFALTTSTVAVGDSPLAGLELSAVSPNPVRDGARFSFRLPQAAEVRLEVIDVLGRRVAVVAESNFPAGAHDPAWRRSAATPPGVYFARLQVGSQVTQRRFVVLD